MNKMKEIVRINKMMKRKRKKKRKKKRKRKKKMKINWREIIK